MCMIYDVFVIYRRIGGFETARYLYDWLSGKGYTVSFDIDTLREGDFDKALLSRIEQCTDFILVVDRQCFDKTIDHSVKPEQDWLRTELAYALQLRKNIIPVLLAGAGFPDGLPEDIEEVRWKNGPTYSHQYFDSFCNKLEGMLHSLPRNNFRVGEKMQSPTNAHPNLKVMCNLDCVMYIDGEEYGTLSAGRLQKIPLAEGEYMLTFESVENRGDQLNAPFEMPNKDKLYNVDLLAKKDEREREEQERRAREERERREREEQERRAREERERREREEQERRTREERERREREERERKAREEQERKERERKERESRGEFEVGGVNFKMMKVEGGTFMMGATAEQGRDAFNAEKPAHEGTLSDYYIGETQVTQALLKAVMGDNPSYFKGDDNLPVEQVSWEDIVERFIPALNRKTGRTFRLPTEAEWEYAARGGNKSRGYKYSGSNNIEEVAWYNGNSGGMTHPVKGKMANELGLYDMSGNVSELCQDWFGDYGAGAQTNPMGLVTGSDRVYRGGSWFNNAGYCRVTYRDYYTPSFRNFNLGFRLVFVP